MGTEAGQSLTMILRRKELERQAGGGSFLWGIGNSLGSGLAELLRKSVQPMVVFSEMRARAKRMDVSPSSVYLWLSYVSHDGEILPLPAHSIVTSRGESRKGTRKARHYALFCKRQLPIGDPGAGSVRFGELRNLVSSKPLGFSQVTSIVERVLCDPIAVQGPEYPVTLTAELTWPYFAPLTNPVPLSSGRLHELRHLSEVGIASSDWAAWVNVVRIEATDRAVEARRPRTQERLAF